MGKRGKVLLSKLREGRTPHPLRAFYEERGIKIADLANALTISPTTLGEYLRGTRVMPRRIEEDLEALAEEIRKDESKK